MRKNVWKKTQTPERLFGSLQYCYTVLPDHHKIISTWAFRTLIRNKKITGELKLLHWNLKNFVLSNQSENLGVNMNYPWQTNVNCGIL